VSAINKKSSGASRPRRTIILMMAATLLAKVLGLLRTVLLASSYGTGLEAAAFAEASVIPLTVFDMLLGAAIPGSFIPVYNRLLAREGTKRADDFAQRFVNIILLFCVLLAGLGIVFSPQLISILAPGLSGNAQKLASELLRIMFPMIIFTGGAYTLTGIMQSKGRYLLPALISAISNAGVIIYLAFINPLLGENGIYGLAAAYVISWLIQLATLVIPLAFSGKERFLLSPAAGIRDSELPAALKSAPPVMIGAWLMPATLLLGTAFSSLSDTDGGISVFTYAYNVYLMITGILTYSICNYVFPELSRLSGSGDDEGFMNTLRRGFDSALMLTVPFTAAVFILSGCGVSVMYQRGAFGAESAAATASALRFIVPAMPAFAVIELLNRAFYSKGLDKIPMIAAICGIASDAVVSAVLIFSGAVPVLSGAAAGACAGQLVTAAALLFAASKKMKGLFDGFIKRTWNLWLGAILSAGVMSVVYRLFDINPFSNSFAGNLIICFAVFLPGAAVYLAVMKIGSKYVVGTLKW